MPLAKPLWPKAPRLTDGRRRLVPFLPLVSLGASTARLLRFRASQKSARAHHYLMPLTLSRGIKEAESQLVKQLLYSGIVKVLGFT